MSDIGGLVGQFVGFGGNLVDGLIGGITTRAAALKDTVVGMASDVADWFKQKLGIQSPSRVFMQAGGFIADGAAVGITEGQDRVRRAVLGLTAGATLALPSLGQASPLVMDHRPPMSAAAAFAGSGGAHMGAPVINITVNAAPGMDGQALSREVARAVAAELARRDSQRRAGRLSALGDLS